MRTRSFVLIVIVFVALVAVAVAARPGHGSVMRRLAVAIHGHQ